MSSTPEITEPSFSPIPPAIQKLLAANVNLLVVETVFPTLLIPITIGLFVFSTPELRRKPVFILNIVAIILGLILGGVSVYTQVSRIRKSCLSSPSELIYLQTAAASGIPAPIEYITVHTTLYFLVPTCVQCILLVRILAVYPPYTLSGLRRTLIYGTLGAIMLARVGNIAYDLHRLNVEAKKLRNWEIVGQLDWALPTSKVECFLQLTYDVCVFTSQPRIVISRS